MKINHLEIENILSIEKASVAFGDAGLVLVEGFDFDTNRANGAGKSAIFNSISYALFDKIPRKITKSEILRHGTKSGFSMVTLTTDAGENLAVKRARPSGAEFFKDGIKVEMTQQEFENKLGIGYEQFLSTMYNAQDSSNRFISLDDRDKKEFILKIMNLESFDVHKKSLSAELTVLSSRKDILKTKIEGYRNTLAAYKTQVVDVAAIDVEIFAKQVEISELTERLRVFEAVKEPDLSKYAEVESQIEQKLLDFMQTRMTANSKRTELTLLKNMKPQAHCPDCNVGLKIVNGALIKAEDEIKINERGSFLISEIKSLEESLLKEDEIKDLSKKIKLKKQDEYQDFNNAKLSIANTRNSISAKSKEIASLSDQIARNDQIQEKVKTLIDDITIAQDELMRITSEEEIIKTVAAFFDPSGAPAYIMDSVIDSFNDAVTDYVSVIWPNASYSLQSYKENKDKSISTKFSESLLMGGKQTSVGSLSGGEFRALSLATDFAIVDVLANKFSIDLNPVILDEPFNGLDSAGKELVIDLLNQIATKRQVWVVDHSSESKALFSRTVRVEKKNGVSDIKDV
jgi:DNA repair exonuclease SbcCD ATPase subunit